MMSGPFLFAYPESSPDHIRHIVASFTTDLSQMTHNISRIVILGVDAIPIHAILALRRLNKEPNLESFHTNEVTSHRDGQNRSGDY